MILFNGYIIKSDWIIMRFINYITEDYETVREYKKAIFDLKVALGEWEFEDGEPVPEDAEKLKLFKQRKLGMKLKVIALKEKIQKLAQVLGESGAEVPKVEGLEEFLAKVPEKESPEAQTLLKKRERFSK